MNDNGQTMAEYLVVLAVVAIAIVATMSVLSGGVDEFLNWLF